MTEPVENNEQSFDQIIHAYYEAVESGQSVAPESFILNYPEYRNELRSFFADLNALNDLPGLGNLEGNSDQTEDLRSRQQFPNLKNGGQVTYIGQYRLIEEIARGGMGVVFVARQEKLDRIVALKMILSGPLASGSEVNRFRCEARSAARLKHPNIVAVHEIGQHDGHHFFTMDYIESDSLAERLREGSLPAEDSAYLVRTIAQAMQYAHSKGVLHRDLKPANILIDRSNQPHITDFGLAKSKFEFEEDETLEEMTRTGQVLGTPSYMSPEQARGKSGLVSVQSDVYSLGAILYACLVGRAPFVGESTLHTLQQVCEADPVRPRSLISRIPIDLETICLKCLEKEPSDRFTLAGLIADLERFLAGRPIKARRISVATRGAKWCKRNPKVAALALSLASAVILGLATSTSYWIRSEIALVDKNKAVVDARQNLHESYLREAQAIQIARKAGFKEQAWSRLQAAMQLDGINVDYSRIRQLAISCMGDFVGVEPVAIDAKDAGLYHACAFLDDETLAVSLYGGGVTIRNIANGDEKSRIYRYGRYSTIQALGTVDRDLIIGDRYGAERWTQSKRGPWIRMWSTGGGFATYGNSLCIFSEGQRLAISDRIGDENVIRIFDTSDGSEVQSIPSLEGLRPVWIAATADGSFIAAASWEKPEFAVWRTKDSKLIVRRKVPTGIPIKGVQFGPNDDFLFVASDEGVFQFSTSDYSQWSVERTERVAAMAVAASGRSLLTPLISGTVHLREANSQLMRASLEHPSALSDQACACFSPSGARFCTSGTGRIAVWDLHAADEKVITNGHSASVKTCVFHPSLSILATGSSDGMVNFWDTNTGAMVSTTGVIESPVQSMSFHPDGRFLAIATGRLKSKIQIWDVRNANSPFSTSTEVEFPSGLNELAFNKDGTMLAATGGSTRLWNVSIDRSGNTLNLQEQELEDGEQIVGHHLSFGGIPTKLVVTPGMTCWSFNSSLSNKIHWRRRSRIFRSNCEWIGSTSNVIGSTMAGTVEIWDLENKSQVQSIWTDNAISTIHCSYANSRKHLAMIDRQNQVSVLNTDNGQVVFRLGQEPAMITKLKFDPDGRRLAVGLVSGGVLIWDLTLMEEKLRAAGLPSQSLAPTGEHDSVWEARPSEINKTQSWSMTHAKREDEIDQLLVTLGLETQQPDPSLFPDQSLATVIESLGGAISSSSAFVTSATRREFDNLCERLKRQNYGICFIRPHVEDGTLTYTGCWKADHESVHRLGLSKPELLKSVDEMDSKGLQLIDIGGQLSEERAEVFWGIWSRTDLNAAKRVVRIGLDQKAIRKSFDQLKKDHMPLVRQAYFDVQGQIRFCEIWTPVPADHPAWSMLRMPPEQMRCKFDQWRHLSCSAIDIALSTTSGSRIQNAVWHTPDEGLETRVVHGVPRDILIGAGKRLMREGFQPKCISICGGKREEQQCSAIWTRQLKK